VDEIRVKWYRRLPHRTTSPSEGLSRCLALPAYGRLFTLLARLKPDIYHKADYPDANNRPIAGVAHRAMPTTGRIGLSLTVS